ncbi:hypothetical protein BXZ70DRAFT_952818 [Cristinia sonorae]|uniref:F-box domain-containing protein n=1 Tax=Cristinia sonorae TaxID=1940300 RepID=A0A8K0UH70_9AGAR|nr:hypothetical protein BXZ70DRAFT_952818 [Cristinia sonorae]
MDIEALALTAAKQILKSLHDLEKITPFPLSSCDAAARHSLQEQIQTHLSAIVALKTRINTCMTIGRIPVEILARIFFWIVVGTHDTRSSRGTRWITITHVCRHWRQVALNTPTLWTDICVEGTVEPAATFLKRSKGAQLHIHVEMSLIAPDIRLLHAVAAESHRAATLSLDLEQNRFNAMSSSFPSAFPHLRQLIVNISGDIPIQTISVLTPAFFSTGVDGRNTSTPALEYLKLTNLQISWANTSFPSTLRCIIFQVGGMVPTDHPSLVSYLDIVHALQGLPLLEVLHLRGVFRALSSPIALPPPVEKHVQLPRLRDMALYGDPTVSIHIMDHLVIPPDCRIAMRLDGNRVPEVATYPFYAAPLRAKLADPIIPVEGKGALQQVAIDQSSVSFFKRHESSIVYPHLLVDVIFGYRDRPESLPVFDLMDAVCHQLPICDVSTLVVTGWLPTNLVWEKILGAMPNIRVLRITGSLPRVVLSLLGTRERDTVGVLPQDRLPPFLMPKLERLELHKVPFRLGEETWDHSSFVERLCEVLSARSDAGSSPVELTITKCTSLWDCDISELQDVVAGTVDWDEEADYYDSDE